MPFVTLNIVEGRDEAAIETCIKEVAKTVSRALDTPIDAVRVIVNEVPPNRWAAGTRLKSE
ncbi:tautomerase family protein [Gordonia bronchialis]|uniref:tautomerase family protein n=1 Tax=Gordonia bronchialis TaxID=2054 RepID=UPI00226E50C5|nr:tautomerase family protein [Gordonia bronchialis]